MKYCSVYALNVPLFHIAYSNTINLPQHHFIFLCFVIIPLCMYVWLFCVSDYISL